MTKIRSGVKAILIRDGHLLTVKSMDPDGPWYALPGGGQRHGETLEEALRRECREETGVEIEVGELRFVRDYIGAHHEYAAADTGEHSVEHMFVCRITDDSRLGSGSEEDPGQVGVEWLPLEDLEDRNLWPKVLRTLVKRLDAPADPVYLGDVN